jgi:Flp pilus assembly protein TadG
VTLLPARRGRSCAVGLDAVGQAAGRACHSRGFAALLRDCRGAALVEFALVAAVLVTMMLPLIDVGMGFYYKTQVMTASQAGAQYAWAHGWNATNVASAVTSATGLTSITASPTATKNQGCWTYSSSTTTYSLTTYGTGGTTTGSAPTLCASPNGQAPANYATVYATVTYTPLLHYAGFGNAITLVAKSVGRIQ